MVNVVLGAKNAFPSSSPTNEKQSFFDRTLYLQVTIDANRDGSITVEDPPLLPRQAIIPVVFSQESGNARSLNGFDWSALFVDSADPSSGAISGQRIADFSVSTSKLQNGSISTEKILLGAVSRDRLAPEIQDDLIPAGTMLPFAGSEAPEGFLLANGDQVEIALYERLFEVIGRRYGDSGDGYFRLPDVRGRFVKGVVETSSGARWISDGGESRTFFESGLGDMGGEEEHTLTYEEMPKHNHLMISGGNSTSNFGVANQGENMIWNASISGVSTRYDPGFGTDEKYDLKGRSGHDRGPTSVSGESNPHNNLPPFISMNWIIKY
jgi:microcystin-dependent protein